jgi:hypothetical protein
VVGLSVGTIPAIDRREVLDVLRHRWQDVLVKEPEQEAPAMAMQVIDAADLGQCRRGVEPLRIVIMPQQDAEATESQFIEPVAVLV